MKYIFGSGIVGLMARDLLGSDWKLVPFYKSRYYTFNPAIADNFIIRHEAIDDYVQRFSSSKAVFFYKRSYSFLGDIIGYDRSLSLRWESKIFGNNRPLHSEFYWKNQENVPIYDVRINQIYSQLLEKYKDELESTSSLGLITEIGDHYFVRNGVKNDFSEVINTIPLNALCSLYKINCNLPSVDMHVAHIATDSLNFEGNNQLFVVDENIDFYKVICVGKNSYVFYFAKYVPNLGAYLMNFMNSFDIIEGTKIAESIPAGQIPKVKQLEDNNIFSVGDSAQWDWCMDLGSCLLRLMQYRCV